MGCNASGPRAFPPSPGEYKKYGTEQFPSAIVESGGYARIMSRAAPGPDELAGLLLRAVGMLRDALDAEAAALGLSSRQGLALLHLGRPTPMGDLAACLRCDASNVTSLADRLEALGLVERAAPAPGADRRVKWLVLTVQGAEARRRLQRQLAARDSAMSALDAAARRDLADLLRRMTGPTDII